jgi:two-component sensor histidine kinase
MVLLPKNPDPQSLAQAIVDTIHEPLLVLDANLRVLAAGRAFYDTFKVDPIETMGCLLYDLGDGQWNAPALRVLLETIIPEHASMDGYEVAHDFPGIGHRVMLLNARKIVYETNSDTNILLAFTDITARRAVEIERAELLDRTQDLLREKEVMLREIQHRVANSLQIIASILMLKAKAVTSEETRLHLKDAHQRVLSVAQVQSQLYESGGVDRIEVGVYLAQLCNGLTSSMIGEDRAITIKVDADHGMIESDKAVSMGLIVTELVINAIKYAFPAPWLNAVILVKYRAHDAGWRLVISDNGVGPAVKTGPAHGGLGTAIVEALVKQLGAMVQIDSDPGMSVTIASL